jgi:Domain of unknown function (DUF4290)
MREYGRHIQRMIEHILTIEDKEKRQQNAYIVIELMGFLNPHLKNVEDFRHKLWDHLFLVSDFKLDVESPYPIPTRETLKAKPQRLPYPKRYPKYSHLGKNLEIIINKGLAEENPEKKQGFANTVAYYMKLAYNNWHKEQVHDDAIRSELNAITAGQLDFTNAPYVKSFQRVDTREHQRDFQKDLQKDYQKEFQKEYRGGPKRNTKYQSKSSSGGGGNWGNNKGGGGNWNSNNNSGGGGKWGNSGGGGGNWGGGDNRNNPNKPNKPYKKRY